MKITLLITTFNSTSQLAYSYLKGLKHHLDIVYAINNQEMIKEVESFNPDIIISPFLKKFVPDEIYTKYPTFILHPGIIGDKGAYSIDNAIKDSKDSWGVVYLRANGEFDSGKIYTQQTFKMRDSYKASIYRNEVNLASLDALKELLNNISDSSFKPTPQLDTKPHKQLTQVDRAIDWNLDSTKEIIKKIYMSDSHPGVLDQFLGTNCYLYGAWFEDRLKSDKPKEILAKRDGAICVSTIDGAIWITHLKEVGKFKLPATFVLKDRLKGVKEQRLPLIFDRSYKTFYEISCDIKDEIAYLHFNFHNGAFSSDKCIKLKYAFEYLKEQAKVVVLMGGDDFFSNGIHLNILEDSKKNGEDGWSNINAMNDLVSSILYAEETITVASLSKNSGAGGVFLALACDYVVANEITVLNPHYKTLGLSGSEYHSYTLPKRVGEKTAKKLLDECLPICADEAHRIGMVDKLFKNKDYLNSLGEFCLSLIQDEEIYDQFLWDKEDSIELNKTRFEECKNKELSTMYPEFWDEDSIFHQLRYQFVYKICPTKTPDRLKYSIINE